MADRIRLNILTANGGMERLVSYVSLPAAGGSIGILAGHIPMLCALEEGTVRYRCGQGELQSVQTGEGVARVGDNEVLLLVSHVTEPEA